MRGIRNWREYKTKMGSRCKTISSFTESHLWNRFGLSFSKIKSFTENSCFQEQSPNTDRFTYDSCPSFRKPSKRRDSLESAERSLSLTTNKDESEYKFVFERYCRVAIDLWFRFILISIQCLLLFYLFYFVFWLLFYVRLKITNLMNK